MSVTPKQYSTITSPTLTRIYSIFIFHGPWLSHGCLLQPHNINGQGGSVERDLSGNIANGSLLALEAEMEEVHDAAALVLDLSQVGHHILIVPLHPQLYQVCGGGLHRYFLVAMPVR